MHFSFQVTPKTLADVKGGTLISYEGRVQVSCKIFLSFLFIVIGINVPDNATTWLIIVFQPFASL